MHAEPPGHARERSAGYVELYPCVAHPDPLGVFTTTVMVEGLSLPAISGLAVTSRYKEGFRIIPPIYEVLRVSTGVLALACKAMDVIRTIIKIRQNGKLFLKYSFSLYAAI